MEDKKYFKKAIFKQKISELRTKKFSFEINRIELPNGHEDEYGQIIFPNAALAVPITKENNCLLYTSPSPRDLSTSRMPSSA